MPDARLQVIIEAVDRASASIKTVGRTIEDHAKQIRQAGLLLAGFGAAGMAILGLTVKAAQEARTSINQLDAALRNAGTSYRDVGRAIEDVLDVQQRKTNFSDEQQRAALTQLVSITGDYRASLEALPAVLDLAAGKGMDLELTSTLVARALEGQTGALTRYGIQLQEGASRTEVMTAILERFGGQAEASADPFRQFSNAVNELREAIGEQLIPLLTPFIDFLRRIVDWLGRLNPTLLKVVAGFTAVASAIAFTTGTAAIFVGTAIPAMIRGLGMLTAAATTSAAAIRGALGFALAGIGGVVGVAGITAIIPSDTNRRINEWERAKQAAADAAHAMAERLAYGETRLSGAFGAATETIQTFNSELEDATTAINFYADQVDKAKDATVEWMEQTIEFIQVARPKGWLDAMFQGLDEMAERLGIARDKLERFRLAFEFDQARASIRNLADAIVGGVALLEAMETAGFSLAEQWKALNDILEKTAPVIEKVNDQLVKQNQLLSVQRGLTRAEADIAGLLSSGTLMGAMGAALANVIPGGAEGLRRFQAGERSPELSALLTLLARMVRIYFGQDPSVRAPSGMTPEFAYSGGNIYVQIDGRTIATIEGRLAQNAEQVRSS